MISRPQAIELIREAETMNPGTWVAHCFNAALAAETITRQVKGFDPDRAYVLALLHDIGRRSGPSHVRHIWEGYHFLKDKDSQAAEICLSHTFPNMVLGEYQGKIDIDAGKLAQMEALLSAIQLDYYHRLVQLCDGYGYIEGFVSLEKRWVDAALRLGINEYTLAKWKKTYQIRDDMNRDYSIDIEKILGL